MDEIETPKEGSMANNPEKPSGRPFSEEWTEAWKQLEERVRQQPGPHLLMALAVGYLLQIIRFRSLRKALPDIGAPRTLTGLRFSAGKIYD
jgi:hypothetical protein